METRGRVLIVDDNDLCVNILYRLLQSEYELDTAGSGNECLAKLYKFKPQLILMDIMMPGIDGHETCRRIKFSPMGENIQIVLVSAKENIVDKSRGSDILADEYILKPFDVEHLRTRVRARMQTMADGQIDPESTGSGNCSCTNVMSDQKQQRLAAALRRLQKFQGGVHSQGSEAYVSEKNLANTADVADRCTTNCE